MNIIDNRKYQYDNEGNIIRERTKNEIKFIELSDSSTAHREWLEHLEELILNVARAIPYDLEKIDARRQILDAINKYHLDMENL